MKAYICDRGDSSVGISPNRMEIDWSWEEFNDKEEREQYRKILHKFAKENFDFGYGGTFDGISVSYSDECGDCLKLLNKEDNKCHNPNCCSSEEYWIKEQERQKKAEKELAILRKKGLPKEDCELNESKDKCFFCDKITKYGRTVRLDKREKFDGLFGETWLCNKCLV